MSEGAFIERFDLVANNSANIELLRSYVIDLALRGKLIDKGDLDVSAPEMLKRIEIRKRSTSKTGKSKSLAPIGKETIPRRYADHCTFDRLGNIANIRKGATGIKSAIPGEFPLVVTAAERSTCDHYDFNCAAAIIPLVSSTGHGHASLNRLHYQEGKFALGTILCAVIPIDEELVSARFLFEYLTAFKDQLLVSQMKGTANVSLTVGKVESVLVPIISPVVQSRVDELMALCDQLDEAHIECEARRDKLVSASLSLIRDPEAAVLESEAEKKAWLGEIFLQNIPQITTRREHIEQMRQAIFSLAVSGRLVPQDPNDEPAAVLLERIELEKSRLIESGEIRASRSQVGRNNSEKPFDIPKNWAWAHFQTVASIQSNLVDPRDYPSHPHIAPDNIESGTGRLLPYRTIGESKVISSKHLFLPGCLLYSKIRPALNKIVSANFEGLCSADMYPLRTFIDREYLKVYFLSAAFVRQSVAEANRVAMPKINQSALNSILVAVPPFAEQLRIVAKVDELTALCDQLIAQLATSESDSRRLLEALLQKANE